MKKLTLISLAVFFIFLGSTYFIGETAQSELSKLLEKQHSSQIKTELISYEKSFFSAKVKLKMTLPVENSEQLEVLVDSDIKHYPYKATFTNHFTMLDSRPAQKIENFFQTKDWITSSGEVNLLGNITSEFTLVEGSFKSAGEALHTQPINIIYQYNLMNKHNGVNIEWDGLELQTQKMTFNSKGINASYHFSMVANTELLNYDYQAQINQLEITTPQADLLIQDADIAGTSKISEDGLTVDTANNWKVKTYNDGKNTFTDNHINLALSDLNLQALTLKKSEARASAVQQSLSSLLERGVKINFENVHSITPWGEIDGKLKLDIQPGAVLAEVAVNPLALIDYMNGSLDLSLPKKLSELAAMQRPIQMGLASGVLKEEGEKLTVSSRLDRGELIVNERVIPL